MAVRNVVNTEVDVDAEVDLDIVRGLAEKP